MTPRQEGQPGHLARLLSIQAALLEIIAAALLLGFGINLLATGLSDHVSPGWGIALGVAASFGGITLLVSQGLNARARRQTIRGFFLYDPTDAGVMSPGPGYPFGAWFAIYLQAAIREHPSIGEQWAERREERLSGLPRMDLAREMAEYVVVKDLSTHLSDYFDEQEQSDAVDHITREHLPEAVKTNRFIDLFGRLPDERPGFAGGTGVESSFSKTSVMTIVVGGGLFEKFDLVLPRGASIMRSGPGNLLVKTRRFTIRLTTSTPGTVTSLPRSYLSLYLGLGEPAANVLAVDAWLTLDIRFHVTALFMPRGWAYYRWLDSWLSSIEGHMSRAGYFDQIGWRQAETLLSLLHAREEFSTRASTTGSEPQES